MSTCKCAASAASKIFRSEHEWRRPRTSCSIGLLVVVAVSFTCCHPKQPPTGAQGTAEPAGHAPTSGSTSVSLVPSSGEASRDTQSEPAPVPAVDSACLDEFKRALRELPACKPYFQRWMAAFRDASEAKAWQRWGEFVLRDVGLSIDNTYEASPSDPNSTASSLAGTIPHAAFLDGTALQRFDELDLRGGLSCIEYDEVWCPDLYCRPYGATQIDCSNQGGGEPFVYRWTLHQGNWYLTEIHQIWLN